MIPLMAHNWSKISAECTCLTFLHCVLLNVSSNPQIVWSLMYRMTIMVMYCMVMVDGWSSLLSLANDWPRLYAHVWCGHDSHVLYAHGSWLVIMVMYCIICSWSVWLVWYGWFGWSSPLSLANDWPCAQLAAIATQPIVRDGLLL